MESTEHLFRRESGRLVATLTNLFGVHNLTLAEDVVQEAFCRALEVWKFSGVPDNPSAWLMTTAKNRALDVLRRERTARTYAPELGRLLESEWTLAPLLEERFTPEAIKDDVLRMMFSCCHPRLPEEAQAALMLHLLCGFSVKEVANALVSPPAAIEKRIQRAKKVLQESKRLFDITSSDVVARLPAVQRAVYLLFNEGYHGAHAESGIRAELCREAIRLAEALQEHRQGAAPTTHALLALMLLNLARLPGRLDASGDMQQLSNQDRSRWDANLIQRGLASLERSASGQELSAYHLEAAIASYHAAAPHIDATNWDMIITLYDRLWEVSPSPVIALNRAIALAQRDGPEQGLAAIAEIQEKDRLDRYPFYAATLGELEFRRQRYPAARAHFSAALKLARNPLERSFFERRLKDCPGS